MRIYPPVPKEEAVPLLTAHAKLIWGDNLPMSEEAIDTLAEAMFLISSIEVPDDIEPLFP